MFIREFSCLFLVATLALPNTSAAGEIISLTTILAGSAVYDSHCRKCHTLDPGRPSYGPALGGVVGRPALSTPSDALLSPQRAKSVIWTRDLLRDVITGYSDVKSAQSCGGAPQLDGVRREALIDYLEATGRGTLPRNI